MEEQHHCEESRRPEILAPAGGPEVLSAALAAGADAVYFGLKKLNARRGAVNFLPETLAETVEQIHHAGAKAYLTLNIQLTQRELGLAFRTLQCAQDAHVDAVLLTDPAILAVRRYFPGLAFHFSTQAGVSSSAGVKAAAELGLSRVVLARELSRDEIAACCRCGVEIETFVQGAHCFSCSGRCLLSSWGGGRSGNRGACTSPCRVKWTNGQGETGTPLSMHDMSLLRDLAELRAMGVASLKIEGRLKSARWVSDAVSLYRKALDGVSDIGELAEQARGLGNYTGRQVSDGFFRGDCSNLTGDSGRVSSVGAPVCGPGDCSGEAPEEAVPHLIIGVSMDEKGGTLWSLAHGDAQESLRIPPQRIANAKRAVTVSDIVSEMTASIPKGEPTAEAHCAPELAKALLPKSSRNSLVEFLERFYRFKDKDEDGVVRNTGLPAGVRALLERPCRKAEENNHVLGDGVTHARLSVNQLADASKLHGRMIVEVNPVSMAEATRQVKMLEASRERIDYVALPPVLYESQIPVLTAMLEKLAGLPVGLEVNSWDTWELARHTGMPMAGGPGLAVLNSLGAWELSELGCRYVTVSPEIDQAQLEALCQAAEVPLALTVFGRPKLMMTRAALPVGFDEKQRGAFCDARNTRLLPMADGAVTDLRSEVPVDWRRIRNSNVSVAMLVADYCGYSGALPPDGTNEGSLFNYGRRLR